MIDYSEEWIIFLICRLKGSVAVRASYFAVPAAIFSLFLVYLDDWAPGLREDLGLMDVNKSQLWSASTGVLLVLLSFRTNRAMARFWEGTGLLHQMRGEWFDSVSCCVTFSRGGQSAKPHEVKLFRHTIVRLMSLCHGSALAEIAGDDADTIITIDSFGLDNRTLQHLKVCKERHNFNRVEVLLHLIQSLITKGLDDGILKIPPPILSRVYQTLSRGFVNLLNAKKIADTRFPFPYAQLIAMLLLLHTVMTPMMISCLISGKVWVPLFTFVPIFGMFSLSFIGIELENPFGDDDNDLPLDHFQNEMNMCLLMLLQENADLIASVDEQRCVYDFSALERTIRNAHHLMADAHTVKDKKRLSQFAQYTSDPLEDEDESDDGEQDHDGKMSRFGSLTSSKATFPMTNSVSTANAAMSLVPLAAAPAAIEPYDPAPVAPPAASPVSVPPFVEEMKLQRTKFVANMREFNNTLEAWTMLVKGQITDLSSTFEALRGFSDSLPELLDSMQSACYEDSPQSHQAPQAPVRIGPVTGARAVGPRACAKPARPGEVDVHVEKPPPPGG